MHATKPLREWGRGKTTVCRIFSCSPRPSALREGGPLFEKDCLGRPLRSSPSERRREPQAASLPVVTGAGSHPFPFRTRKLSLLPPMVLHGKLCGRVGRCRHYLEGPIVERRSGHFFVPAAPHHPHSFPCSAQNSR